MASSLPTPPAQNKPKARPQGREHDNHLHACAQHAGSGHPKPARLTRIASRKRQSDRLLRVPVTQEFHIPPRSFLADVFRAIVRYVIPLVHWLNPIAAVSLKPAAPDVLSRLAFAVTPKRVK